MKVAGITWDKNVLLDAIAAKEKMGGAGFEEIDEGESSFFHKDILKCHRFRTNNGILYMLGNKVSGTQEGHCLLCRRENYPFLHQKPAGF